MAYGKEFGRRSVIGELTTRGVDGLHLVAPRDLLSEFARDGAKYQAAGVLGSGGMGDVLMVRDRDLRRDVAMKVLHADLAAIDEQRIRFIAEAQATSQLDHPGIPPVHDVGIAEDGAPWFTMKLVRGRTLRDVLDSLLERDEEAEREYTLHRLISILERIAEAVHFAHEKGVIHRDLKPENVMLGEFGEVHVMDWGIARSALGTGLPRETLLDTSDAAAGVHTLDGTVKGTIPYMSPEQASGRVSTLDRRSDVYALGVLLYEMLTLQPAFEGDDLVQVFARVCAGAVTDVELRNPSRSVPHALARLCRHAMAHAVEERPATAGELRASLRSWLDGSAERERRHAEAERLAGEGRAAAQRYRRLKADVVAAEDLAEEEAARYEPWQPVSEKLSSLEARRRVEGLRAQVALAFAETTQLLGGALIEEETNPSARAALADLWRERLEMAEAADDHPDVVHAESMVRRYDDGQLARFLSGEGTLELTSDPPGATVLLSRLEPRDGLLAPLGERVLGRTPLGPLEVPMGSYLCVLRLPGFRDVRYPVHITRNRAWSGRVRLLTDEQIGDEFVFVPGGPFVYGEGRDAVVSELPDFAIGRYPVTFGEYAEFLAAIEGELGREAAARHIPRTLGEGACMERLDDGRYRAKPDIIEGPAVERLDAESGDAWRARLPALAVNWDDVTAYCDWKTRTTGRPWRLPTEQEREKAARGVDGRQYPWGDLADASLAKCRDSRDEAAQPEPVGAFPTAVSVYGMGDAAGGVWEWTDSWFSDRCALRVLRGGSWYDVVTSLRTTCRAALPPDRRGGSDGFRCARSEF